MGLNGPRDGGAPVGYAVIDGYGDSRYQTLDPSAVSQLAEIDTILRAAQ